MKVSQNFFAWRGELVNCDEFTVDKSWVYKKNVILSDGNLEMRFKKISKMSLR